MSLALRPWSSGSPCSARAAAFVERWVTMLRGWLLLMCAEGPWFAPGYGWGDGLKLYCYIRIIFFKGIQIEDVFKMVKTLTCAGHTTDHIAAYVSCIISHEVQLHDTPGTKHLGHLPNIELHHLFPSEFASIRGLYNVSKAFHRDAGQCWLQCFSQLCQVGWMSFGWWDNSWFTWETWAWNPTSHSVLDTNWCALHLPPYLVQRHFYLLSCPFTLWMAHTHNPCLNCLKA
jgi:hypothetical protein